MTTAERIISALSSRGGFDGWWDDIGEDIQQEVIAEIDGIVANRETFELAYLRWFHDYGVVADDVMSVVQREYADEIGPVPERYSVNDDEDDDE